MGAAACEVSPVQLKAAGAASTPRADEFAQSVRPHIRAAMADGQTNYTRAAAILNDGKQLSAEGKPWDRRGVAAVVRRLQRLKLWQ